MENYCRSVTIYESNQGIRGYRCRKSCCKRETKTSVSYQKKLDNYTVHPCVMCGTMVYSRNHSVICSDLCNRNYWVWLNQLTD